MAARESEIRVRLPGKLGRRAEGDAGAGRGQEASSSILAQLDELERRQPGASQTKVADAERPLKRHPTPCSSTPGTGRDQAAVVGVDWRRPLLDRPCRYSSSHARLLSQSWPSLTARSRPVTAKVLR